MQFVSLQLTPGLHGVWLRDVTGRHELLVNDSTTQTAIALLRELLWSADNKTSIDAARLVSADRDRVLASLYKILYGQKIESSINCKYCSQLFDVSFGLDDLLAHNIICQKENADGFYELNKEVKFRLPTGEDELLSNITAGNAEQVLMQRCVPAELSRDDMLAIQEAMEKLAPVLSLNLGVRCAECGEEQEAAFDLQRFLLTRINNEQKNLLAEVHLLAKHYHWSYNEIIDLPRQQRKRYVALIQSA